jgi:hypothetical protein
MSDAVQQTIAEEAETDDAKNQDAAANASPVSRPPRRGWGSWNGGRRDACERCHGHLLVERCHGHLRDACERQCQDGGTATATGGPLWQF